MSIINNRFISAFLDAFPSSKKKVFEPVANAAARLCNDDFRVDESGLVSAELASFEAVDLGACSAGDSVKHERINSTSCAKVARSREQDAQYGKIIDTSIKIVDAIQLGNQNSDNVNSPAGRLGSVQQGECYTKVSSSAASSSEISAQGAQHSKNNRACDTLKWDRVTSRLRKFYGEKIYRSWLKFLIFDKIENAQVFLSVPTGFVREWIMVNYSDNILEFFRSEDKSITSIEICVSDERGRQSDSKHGELDAPFVHTKNDEEINKSSRESLADNLSSSLDWNRTFDNFVVGKSNELAFTASKRVAESAELPITGSNPLFLYGGVGLGKTHLMHAIVWHIKENYKNRRVIYLSAEKFMYKYITALKNKDMMSFKQIFRSVDVLMVDDVQFISGKENTQEEFFHTFNALIEQNKQLVISADRSPSDLQGVEERIQSRLSWGLVADINQTTFELRVGILESKLEQMKSNIIVPKKVIEFMARNIVSNVRELEGALNKIIAHADITGSVITVDSAKDLLADILRTNSIAVTLDNILLKVSEYFNIKISDLKSQRRVKDVAYARQVCMFLSKSLTQRSLLDIGKFLGGRDHATVIHSVRKIELLIKNDARVAEDIRMLTKRLT